MNLANIVAAIVKVPADFIDEVKVSMADIDRQRAERGTPDEWEAKVLADFDKRAAAGEKRETMEVGEIVAGKEGKVFRYMKALPVQEACLNCHGDTASLNTELKTKLANLYPNDKATGYKIGDIRGALTVKRNIP